MRLPKVEDENLQPRISISSLVQFSSFFVNFILCFLGQAIPRTTIPARVVNAHLHGECMTFK